MLPRVQGGRQEGARDVTLPPFEGERVYARKVKDNKLKQWNLGPASPGEAPAREMLKREQRIKNQC